MATITANPAFDLLTAEGEEVIVGGNTPFLMDGADKVWFVASGRVEVFAVNVVDGHPDGARHHYLTADPATPFRHRPPATARARLSPSASASHTLAPVRCSVATVAP